MRDLTGFTGLIPAPIHPTEVGTPRKVIVEEGKGEVLKVILFYGEGKAEVPREYLTPKYYILPDKKAEGD